MEHGFFPPEPDMEVTLAYPAWEFIINLLKSNGNQTLALAINVQLDGVANPEASKK